MASNRDPWTLERKRLGGSSVLRVIDRENRTQAFQRVAPRPDCSDVLLDGCTLIWPAAETSEERAAVLKEFDELYWKATP